MLKQPEHHHLRQTPIQESTELLRSAQEVKKFSRRTFFGLAALTGVALADTNYTKEIQRERDYVDVKTVSDQETANKFPHSAWLFLPGFKTSWEEADWMTGSLEPTMKERGQIARVGYSNTGFVFENIYQSVRRHVESHDLHELFLYGHSFGGMLAVQLAARLEQDKAPATVSLITLDSSPHSRADVKDQQMFDDIALTYSPDYLAPTTARAVLELGERVAHKNERSWQTVIQQTVDQLKPAAPSTELMQTEAVYIYDYSAGRYADQLNPATKICHLGNPLDDTVDFAQAHAGWKQALPHNFLVLPYSTVGTQPPHASPQWNSAIYNTQLREIQYSLLPDNVASHLPVKKYLIALPA